VGAVTAMDNEKLVTDAQRHVLEKHPSAWAVYNSDRGGFKVYRDKVTFVALSETCPTEAGAWQDALKYVRRQGPEY